MPAIGQQQFESGSRVTILGQAYLPLFRKNILKTRYESGRARVHRSVDKFYWLSAGRI